MASQFPTCGELILFPYGLKICLDIKHVSYRNGDPERAMRRDLKIPHSRSGQWTTCAFGTRGSLATSLMGNFWIPPHCPYGISTFLTSKYGMEIPYQESKLAEIGQITYEVMTPGFWTKGDAGRQWAVRSRKNLHGDGHDVSAHVLSWKRVGPVWAKVGPNWAGRRGSLGQN